MPSISSRRNNGFTLIEVLIALLVLSFGLLGLAMLQATGLRFNNDSYMRTQATILAYDLIDRIRANKAASDAGYYCITTTGSTCTTTAAASTAQTCGDSTGGCSSSRTLAEYDLSYWYDLQTKFLAPGASASSLARTVVTTTSGQTIYQYTIVMRWSERETNIAQTWVVEI
jgi:type IV pilus assembly protein PilV